MTKQTEAMKLALEALEGLEALLLSMGLTHLIVYGDAEKAITALQEALASEAIEQPAQQQELVAWMHKETGLLRQANKAKGGDFEPNHWTPLYTAIEAKLKEKNT